MESTRHAEAERLRRVWEGFEPPEGFTAEWFAGQIVMQAAPLLLHQIAAQIFGRAVPAPYLGITEAVVDLGDEGRPEPDAVVIRQEDLPIDHRVRELPPSLILAAVEVVSDASVHRDYVDKHTAYATAGIPVYVIIDPRDGTWIVHHLAGGAYDEWAKGVFGAPMSLPEPLEWAKGVFGAPMSLPEPLGFAVPTVAMHPYPPD